MATRTLDPVTASRPRVDLSFLDSQLRTPSSSRSPHGNTNAAALVLADRPSSRRSSPRSRGSASSAVDTPSKEPISDPAARYNAHAEALIAKFVAEIEAESQTLQRPATVKHRASNSRHARNVVSSRTLAHARARARRQVQPARAARQLVKAPIAPPQYESSPDSESKYDSESDSDYDSDYASDLSETDTDAQTVVTPTPAPMPMDMAGMADPRMAQMAGIGGMSGMGGMGGMGSMGRMGGMGMGLAGTALQVALPLMMGGGMMGGGLMGGGMGGGLLSMFSRRHRYPYGYGGYGVAPGVTPLSMPSARSGGHSYLLPILTGLAVAAAGGVVGKKVIDSKKRRKAKAKLQAELKNPRQTSSLRQDDEQEKRQHAVNGSSRTSKSDRFDRGVAELEDPKSASRSSPRRETASENKSSTRSTLDRRGKSSRGNLRYEIYLQRNRAAPADDPNVAYAYEQYLQTVLESVLPRHKILMTHQRRDTVRDVKNDLADFDPGKAVRVSVKKGSPEAAVLYLYTLNDKEDVRAWFKSDRNRTKYEYVGWEQYDC